MFATYVKTATLGSKQFRGQRALVVRVLQDAKTPLSSEQIAKLVDAKGEYTKTFKPTNWAVEKANGVLGSVRYHLRALVEDKMVAGAGEVAETPKPKAAPKAKAKAEPAKAA